MTQKNECMSSLCLLCTSMDHCSRLTAVRGTYASVDIAISIFTEESNFEVSVEGYSVCNSGPSEGLTVNRWKL
jgi:hypothetical protein